MYTHLIDIGTEAMRTKFPNIAVFENNNDTRKYQVHEIPEPTVIQSIAGGHLQKMKKQKEYASVITLDKARRGEVMKYLLHRSNTFEEEFEDNDVVDRIISELIEHGLGSRILTNKLIQKNLVGLPVSEESDWSRDYKKKIVNALKTDLSNVIIPEDDNTEKFEFIAPINIRHRDEDDVDDSDSEDDDDEDKDYDEWKRNRKDAHPVDALENGYPLDFYTIRNLRRHIGRTFEDRDVPIRNKNKTEQYKKFKISGVYLYRHDKSTFFFEYHDVNDFIDKSPEVSSKVFKGREFTQCIEFGKDPFQFDDDFQFDSDILVAL
jgi:hypothetical protein